MYVFQNSLFNLEETPIVLIIIRTFLIFETILWKIRRSNWSQYTFKAFKILDLVLLSTMDQ